VTKKLFILGVIAIPFTGVYGFLPLGELQNVLSVYLFLVTMALTFASRLHKQKGESDLHIKRDATYLLPKIMLLTLLVIGVSFLLNFSDIIHGEFRGRTAIEKYTTSTMVVLYGFGLAYVSYYLGDENSWREIIMWPIAISVAICAFVAGLEMLSWFSAAAESIYMPISNIVHMIDYTENHVQTMADMADIGRARSVCYEPPSLANFAGFAWPWMYAGFRGAKPKAKPLYLILWALCTLLILAAWSRTSAVLLVGNILVLFLLRFVYLPPKTPNPVFYKATSAVILTSIFSVVAVFMFNIDAMISYVVSGDSVSNITRFASMATGFRMFLGHPLAGYGFGQYGFHILEYMPGWGYYSWEISTWLVTPTAVWPPVFSIYARFAAELGLLGLVLWIGIWFGLARSIWRITLIYQNATGQMLLLAYPLIISCYGVLLSGLAFDSLRTPMMWITLGLGCCYLHDVRSRLSKLHQI